MKVTFKRTGERRYGVFAEREKGHAPLMHPAPGIGTNASPKRVSTPKNSHLWSRLSMSWQPAGTGFASANHSRSNGRGRSAGPTTLAHAQGPELHVEPNLAGFGSV
jgi:hypothetical protein